MEKISLDELSRKIGKPWSPVDIMFVNDSVIRMAKVEGEFVWHKHDNGDEVFLVLMENLQCKRKRRISI